MGMVLNQLINQLLPIKLLKLHNLWYRYRTHGLRNTISSVWRQSVTRITGIPVLSDGRVTRLVYVGPQYGRLGKWRLRLAGVRHTVNLRAEFNDANYDLTLGPYRHFPTKDGHAPSLEHLWEGTAFIQGVVDRDEKVYIHCKEGKGRAPTLAAAYLISRGLACSQAIDLVQHARLCAGLTASQRAQLEIFARDCDARGGQLVTAGHKTLVRPLGEYQPDGPSEIVCRR